MFMFSVLFLTLLFGSPSAGSASEKPLALLSCAVPLHATRPGGGIPLVVELRNNMKRPLRHASPSLVPTDKNYETIGLDIQAVYRDTFEKGSLRNVTRPLVDFPHALPTHEVPPGGTLIIKTDARKWQIEGGWIPGRYWISVRMGYLTVDPWTTLSVTSRDLCSFEIR